MKIAILHLSCHVMSSLYRGHINLFHIIPILLVSLNSEWGSKLKLFNLVFKQIQEFQAITSCCRMSPTSLRYKLGYGFRTS